MNRRQFGTACLACALGCTSQTGRPCYDCKGKGKRVCHQCLGEGQILFDEPSFSERRECTVCAGKGYLTCSTCAGKGRLPDPAK
ncbi:MAG: hypothetical protein AB7K24_25650 [Gemmataceae bacterium]